MLYFTADKSMVEDLFSKQFILESPTTLRTHLINQRADQFGFKDVSQRNPVEKTQEGFQSGVDQGGILGIFLRYNQ